MEAIVPVDTLRLAAGAYMKGRLGLCWDVCVHIHVCARVRVCARVCTRVHACMRVHRGLHLQWSGPLEG